MTKTFVVHFGEIGTKGGNRSSFEASLERNIRWSLRLIPGFRLEQRDQRYFVSVVDEEVDKVRKSLAQVFGVAWFAEVDVASLDYGEIKRLALVRMKSILSASGKTSSTFRVSARRSNKSFGMNSQDLAIQLGHDIVSEVVGLSVDLTTPEVTQYLDILSDRAILYQVKEKGPGGLPVGTSGRVLHLISGGIDSPVAAYLMMKRGCSVSYLHFYSASSAEALLSTKMTRLFHTLYQLDPSGARAYLVPFDAYQLATVDVPQEYEPIVFRHFLRIVAEKLAFRLGIPAISTGDNLAQVASQTLQNLTCIDAEASLPTLRPLLTFDKDEIVQLAKRIGTYETSIEAYKDCCSIVSRHPRTRMKPEMVLETSRRHRFEALAKESLDNASVMSFSDQETPLLRPAGPLLTEFRREGDGGYENESEPRFTTREA